MSCDTSDSVVTRGTAIARNFGIEGLPVLTGWTCSAQLRYTSSRELIVNIPSVTELNAEYTNDKGEIIPANTEFVVRLTGEQMTIGDNSADISVTLAAELTNPATNENPEGSTEITIKQEWVYS